MSAIDYDLKKIRAIVFDIDGVLSPSVVGPDDHGRPVRMSNVKDGYAIHQAAMRGLRLCIISGGDAEPMRKRFSGLGISDIFMKVSEKLPVLRRWIAENGFSEGEVAYMGDDIPDLPSLRAVGLSACPYDAAHEVQQTVRYISRFSGGYGCARDLIEQVLRAKGEWCSDEKAYAW